VTTFLANETLWRTLSLRVKRARRVYAAIAYFGQGGAKRLPLRKGDCLVVDMSPATVRAGATDPREIEKLVKRNVRVFTRRNLHAKLIVADGSAIVGSANISKHSEQVLDEAAVLTDEPAAIRRAREFIDRLCTEPVRQDYLKKCKQMYKPPRFSHLLVQGNKQQQRTAPAKLWIVNLREYVVPESELRRYEKGEMRAQKQVKNKERSETTSFHWPSKPKMADELQVGDWFIEVLTKKDKSILVNPPCQLLLVDNYVRNTRPRKERWVFHVEVPRGGQAMAWSKFRGYAKGRLGHEEFKSPRTKPIRDVQAADYLLGLWTPSGRISRW
jgi:hypothetical protein